MRKSLRAKAFGLILLVALILSLFAIMVTFRVHENTMDNHYTAMTQRVAKTEALAMDGDRLRIYGDRTRAIFNAYCEQNGVPDLENMTEDEQAAYCALYEEVYEMDGYAEEVAELSAIAEANDVMYMYITLWDVDHGVVIYLMDGSVYGEPTDIGWVEPIEEANLERIRKGDLEIEPYITNYPEYGWLCTATAPILDSEGTISAHAYVDISMVEVKAEVYKFLFNITLMLAVLTVGLMIVTLRLVNVILVSPIKKMSRAATMFVSNRSKKQMNVFGSLNIRTKDELGQLSSAMQTMETEISEYISHITEITAEKERVGAELNVATQIQADMLPSIFPAFPNHTEFDIYASMDPAKEVGGDFYDFFLVDDKHLAMVMADVSGKGVPAALFMVIAKTLIKNRAQAGGSPAEILRDVNNQLCEGNKAQLFVTVWLAIMEISTGKGVAANAGHEDPVIRRGDGQFELVKYRHSPAVAVMENLKFREHEFELHPGDTLFVYTDGVPEATNAASELYGTGRLLDVLNANSGQPLGTILSAVKADIDSFVGSAPQFDDITMLGLNYYGNGGDQQ